MKTWLLGAVTAAALLVAATAQAASVKEYKTEAGAQKHCPTDTVVWANTSSGVYHLKGTRWYGKTQNGRYVCMGEASGAGWKQASNNQ